MHPFLRADVPEDDLVSKRRSGNLQMKWTVIDRSALVRCSREARSCGACSLCKPYLLRANKYTLSYSASDKIPPATRTLVVAVPKALRNLTLNGSKVVDAGRPCMPWLLIASVRAHVSLGAPRRGNVSLGTSYIYIYSRIVAYYPLYWKHQVSGKPDRHMIQPQPTKVQRLNTKRDNEHEGRPRIGAALLGVPTATRFQGA